MWPFHLLIVAPSGTDGSQPRGDPAGLCLVVGALLTGAACVMLLLAAHDLHAGEDEQNRRIRRKIEAARRRDPRRPAGLTHGCEELFTRWPVFNSWHQVIAALSPKAANDERRSLIR